MGYPAKHICDDGTKKALKKGLLAAHRSGVCPRHSYLLILTYQETNIRH